MTNQKGFTLTEIVIALGLMGGISLVTMKLMEDQVNNQKLLVTSAEVSKTMNLIGSALNDSKSCMNILGGKSVGNIAALQSTQNHAGTVISKYYLEASKNYADFRIPADGIKLNKLTTAGQNNAELVFTFFINSKKGATGNTASTKERSIIKKFPLNVKWNTAGTQIESCAPLISDVSNLAKEKFCDSLGTAATWDSATNTCKLNATNMKCQPGYYPKVMQNLGTVTCQLILATDIFVDSTNNPCTVGTGVQIVFDSTVNKYKLQCI